MGEEGARLVRVVDTRSGKILLDREKGIAPEKPTQAINETEKPLTNDQTVTPDIKLEVEANAFPNNLLIMSVMADPSQPYVGYELLQALLSAGFRFGKMNIFHRYQQLSGNGPVLFSLASATKPGTFELSKIGGYACAGLTLFMQVDDDKDLLMAFECMLDTAHQLIDDLGGQLWDDERKPLTEEKIAWWRTQLAAREENRHTSDMFAA
ncbi:MAG: cell division protein ZipA [Coxiellaceae bacterium]|nr:MAG: cell division protein ZipA [Coxiellaceae bacterium]